MSISSGLPLETLSPLLSSDNSVVRRVAVWIASELGEQGRPLIGNAIALITDEDRYIRFHASEVLAVCSLAEDIDSYEYVVRLLEDRDDAVRVHVMFLMSNANVSQLKAAARSFGSTAPSDDLHRMGLSQLVADRPDNGTISGMIDSVQPLLRKYGAIAAWRSRAQFPELFSGLEFIADPDLKSFWKQRVPRKYVKAPSVGNQ